MSTRDYELVSTDKLREGDVINNYGMMLELRSKKEYPHGFEGRIVYQFKGYVQNLDEVKKAGLVPIGWLFDNTEGEPIWTVQGNNLAKWFRVKD